MFDLPVPNVKFLLEAVIGLKQAEGLNEPISIDDERERSVLVGVIAFVCSTSMRVVSFSV